MDEAQCREKIKAWGCAIIVNVTKETNLNQWANISKKKWLLRFQKCFTCFFVKEVRSSRLQYLHLFQLKVLISHVLDTCYSKNKEDNIIFDLYLKRLCMHDVCNLKYVCKLECLSHKPSLLVLCACDSIWFARFFVDIYLVALCCLVSVLPNILWLITFANFQKIETFHMNCQWWRQKFSAAIASVIIFVVISVHFTDQNFDVHIWSQF